MIVAGKKRMGGAARDERERATDGAARRRDTLWTKQRRQLLVVSSTTQAQLPLTQRRAGNCRNQKCHHLQRADVKTSPPLCWDATAELILSTISSKCRKLL